MASIRQPSVPGAAGSSQHRSLGLSDSNLLDMYYTMILARTIDERWWMLNRQGKAAFVITGQGQEATQIGAGFALQKGKDWIVPYYRDLGMVLALGMSPRELMLCVFARADDPNSGGRQMPGHWGSRRLHIFTTSSPVGTQIPHAAGIALAAKIRGEDTVTLTSFGEGATSTGDFHEGLNFASVHSLPVVFLCENNGYAISVPQSKEMAVARVADRASAYALPGVSVDGNDVLAVYAAVHDAVVRARGGGGPTLVEARTYRFTPHSSSDDDSRYRAKDEVEEWRHHDPIERFKRYLEKEGVLDAEIDGHLRVRVSREVDEATEYAANAPDAVAEDLLKNVYHA